jgi:hypothetical protein
MTQSHQPDRNRNFDASAPQKDDHAAPGRSANTGALVGPRAPTTSGLVMRKARDANGVMEGAEETVAAATSSSGVPLPTTLMRKFEASLGAELSGVRVHTGGASEQAASSVGAKTYTVGNDIHFGAGHARQRAIDAGATTFADDGGTDPFNF